MDELTQMNADPETRAEYDARVREMSHLYASQNLKYKEGIEKGRAEERTKAEAEKKAEKIDNERKALSIGLTVDQVASITGLSVEEIKKLKE